MLINSMHSEVFALQNSRLSSAKKRWVIVGQPPTDGHAIE